VPAAIKLQEEYGDAIQVILVHAQNATAEQAVNYAMMRKWLGNQAIWTSDYPFSTGSGGLPSFALLDASGRVILKGNSASMHSQIEDEIERMVKEGGAAPEGTPKAVAKVYAELAKGNLAKASAAAEKAKAKPGSKDPESVVAAAEAALAAVNAKLDGDLARGQWMLDNGYPLEAEAKFKVLGKAVKGDSAMSAKVEEALAKLDGESLKPLVSAAKELAKLEANLYGDPKNDKAKAKLADFAQEQSSNAVGKRASKLVDVATAPEVR